MTIQEALSIIKPAEHTMEALKSAYRQEAKRFHPDVNPHGLELMKLVNLAYDMLIEQFNKWTLHGFECDAVSLTEAMAAIFAQVKHCVGIRVEVCGSWLWINGNTYPYKAIFREAGLKWSQNKYAWYWHAEGYRKRSKKRFGMDEIRQMWGSENLETEPLQAVA